MRLLLIRHGESVDNVAGLYAGSRDSPLTSHGVLQARRLAARLVGRSSTIGPINQIFCSNLSRAAKTAEIIADAQIASLKRRIMVQPVAELRERDFGSDEGKRVGSRTAGPSPGASTRVEPESQESMRVRAHRFIDRDLVLALARMTSSAAGDLDRQSLAIVAHGIILNALLRCLLSRFGRSELARLQVSGSASPGGRKEWLAAWSNTGYLEMEVRVSRPTVSVADTAGAKGRKGASPVYQQVGPATLLSTSRSQGVMNIVMAVKTVNCTEHLQGLKKTRGGIGSAKFDEKQKTMESFLSRPSKKPKVSRDPSQ